MFYQRLKSLWWTMLMNKVGEETSRKVTECEVHVGCSREYGRIKSVNGRIIMKENKYLIEIK